MAQMHSFHRFELQVGTAGYERVQHARFAVIGLGGIGGYVAEALARSGVAHLTLVDFDRVCITNLNRQIHATRKSVNQPKATLVAERVASIHPKCDVRALQKFFGEDTADEILAPGFDVVFDCIDNMTAKVQLVEACIKRGLPIVCALGAGGRMDPTRVRVTDLEETHTDPFARIFRDQLRQRGIERGVTCVWSDEPPVGVDPVVHSGFKCICPDKSDLEVNHCETRFQIQGSNGWMPAIFGLTMAGVAINGVLGRKIETQWAEPPKRDKPSPNKPSRATKRALLAARTNGVVTGPTDV